MNKSLYSLTDSIACLENSVGNPNTGLPEEVFLMVSRLMPLVNVDLLIRNHLGQTLLTWRDDSIFGQGWHVPGGIIRWGESFSDRLSLVAADELGAKISFREEPLAILQSIDKTRTSRAHHVSLLFECRLITQPRQENEYQGDTLQQGMWAWHSWCPESLLQKEYEDWL